MSGDGSEVVRGACGRRCRQLDAAGEAVTRQLRGLPEVVLRVVSVQPLGAAQRRTAPFPPRPHPLARPGGGAAGGGGVARCLEPQELLVHLESSGAPLTPSPDPPPNLCTAASAPCSVLACLRQGCRPRTVGSFCVSVHICQSSPKRENYHIQPYPERLIQGPKPPHRPLIRQSGRGGDVPDSVIPPLKRLGLQASTTASELLIGVKPPCSPGPPSPALAVAPEHQGCRLGSPGRAQRSGCHAARSSTKCKRH